RQVWGPFEAHGAAGKCLRCLHAARIEWTAGEVVEMPRGAEIDVLILGAEDQIRPQELGDEVLGAGAREPAVLTGAGGAGQRAGRGDVHGGVDASVGIAAAAEDHPAVPRVAKPSANRPHAVDARAAAPIRKRGGAQAVGTGSHDVRTEGRGGCAVEWTGEGGLHAQHPAIDLVLCADMAAVDALGTFEI